MKTVITMSLVLLLGGAASAGSFTTTPEQDKTLAAIAADTGVTTQVALGAMIDKAGKTRAKQKATREVMTVQRACQKGNQKACDAMTAAAKDVKK